jgi:acetoin utilization deacetylase AcuC-like enzyme
MTRVLMDIAKSECGGKLLFVLEGGYDLEALANSVEAVVMELKRMPVRKADELEENRSRAVLEVVSTAKQTLKPYWGEF